VRPQVSEQQAQLDAPRDAVGQEIQVRRRTALRALAGPDRRGFEDWTLPEDVDQRAQEAERRVDLHRDGLGSQIEADPALRLSKALSSAPSRNQAVSGDCASESQGRAVATGETSPGRKRRFRADAACSWILAKYGSPSPTSPLPCRRGGRSPSANEARIPSIRPCIRIEGKLLGLPKPSGSWLTRKDQAGRSRQGQAAGEEAGRLQGERRSLLPARPRRTGTARGLGLTWRAGPIASRTLFAVPSRISPSLRSRRRPRKSRDSSSAFSTACAQMHRLRRRRPLTSSRAQALPPAALRRRIFSRTWLPACRGPLGPTAIAPPGTRSGRTSRRPVSCLGLCQERRRR